MPNSHSWPDVSIRNHCGVPCLHLDGSPLFLWGVQRRYAGGPLGALERLSTRGIRCFQPNATCTEDIYHPQLRFWQGPDRFDGAAQEDCFRRVLAMHDKALLMLRVYVGAPEWWLRQHPEECVTFADGHREHDVRGAGRGGFRALAPRRLPGDVPLHAMAAGDGAGPARARHLALQRYHVGMGAPRQRELHRL